MKTLSLTAFLIALLTISAFGQNAGISKVKISQPEGGDGAGAAVAPAELSVETKTALDGTAEMGFGEHGLAMGNAALRFPLSQKFNSRFAGFPERRDGFGSNEGLKNQNHIADLRRQPDDRTLYFSKRESRGIQTGKRRTA